MRVLLTGAQGVIGQRVVRSLRSRPGLELASLVSVRSEPGEGVLAVDIADPDAFREALDTVRPDVVVHLAALTGQACDQDPGLADDINVGSVNTLTVAARELGISRIVFASTSAVYGDQYNEPTRESAPIVLGSHYARTKYAAERALDHGNVESINLRIFNVFGPGLQNSLVTRLVESAPDRPVELRGLDTFVRDYIHVDDLVDAIESALTKSLPQQHVTFNIGSGIETSNRQLLLDLGIDQSRYSVSSGSSASYSCARIDAAQRGLDFQPSRRPGDSR